MYCVFRLRASSNTGQPYWEYLIGDQNLIGRDIGEAFAELAYHLQEIPAMP